MFKRMWRCKTFLANQRLPDPSNCATKTDLLKSGSKSFGTAWKISMSSNWLKAFFAFWSSWEKRYKQRVLHKAKGKWDYTQGVGGQGRAEQMDWQGVRAGKKLHREMAALQAFHRAVFRQILGAENKSKWCLGTGKKHNWIQAMNSSMMLWRKREKQRGSLGGGREG